MKNLFKYPNILFFNSVFPNRNPASLPTKLLCFTRSSPLVHKLSAHYSVQDAQTGNISQHTHLDLVFPDPSQLVVYTLSSLVSQSSMQEMLKEFVQSDKTQVSF